MQAHQSELFRSLHSNNQALLLINIWDAASAILVEKSGAMALATSSASLAWANGFADGGALPRDVLLSSINKIINTCTIPLTVDIEDGYSDSPEEVASLVTDLAKLGVAGINIEDGYCSPELLVEKISTIRSIAGIETFFINARTDVYLRELVEPERSLNETLYRLEQYVAAGADGVFVPGMLKLNDISKVSCSIQAPLNVMTASNSNGVKGLERSGAVRISLGPNSFIDAYSAIPKIANTLFDNGVENDLNYHSLNELFSS